MPIDSFPIRAPGAPSIVLLSVLALGGCALPGPAADRQRSEDGVRLPSSSADAARFPAAQGQALHEPRYLRFKPDETQLTGALDDGHFTYLEFATPVTGEAEFFDQDGRSLPAASAGRVAAVHGLHAGLLV